MKEFDRERWWRFASYVARARAKPTFDVEERDPKLVILERLRETLEVVGHESELTSRVERLELASRNLYGLLRPREFQWLRAWAVADSASLAVALAPFATGDGDEQSRFVSWAEAAQRATAAGSWSSDADAALAVGSLFNFATEPDRLPIVRESLFDWLERELGYEVESDRTSAARYGSHLDFARRVHRRLLDDEIAVRDMIDVQSLIFIAVHERDFWAVDPPKDIGAAPEAPRSQPYLSICAIYRDEAPYLSEWIEFHRLVGVERFFLYDNQSGDAHLEVLAPYTTDGTVVLHEWPLFPGQMEAYDHCLTAHGTDSRWIAFLDVDEFLFSPERRPLPELLRDYEGHPAVGVNRATFGTSGHRTRPAGLVIENYLHRGGGNRFIKSIVQPRSAIRCLSAHRFGYRYRLAVDENGYPIHADSTKSLSFARLRINHYYTKSEAELQGKLGAPRPDYGQARYGSWDIIKGVFNQERDDQITYYAAQVRAALEAKTQRRAGQ